MVTVTARRVVLLAAGLYLLRVAATYLLEGRVELLQRPDPLGRALYAVVANIVIGTALAGWVLRALTAEGVVHAVPRAGSLFGVAFLPEVPRDYATALTQQSYRYAPFFHAMLDAGVSLPPSVFEAWFLTAAHDDVALERVLEALPVAAKAAAEALDPTLLAQ